MTLNELLIRLNELKNQNPEVVGGFMVMDTDGNSIINANISDMDDEPIIYIEASF